MRKPRKAEHTETSKDEKSREGQQRQGPPKTARGNHPFQFPKVGKPFPRFGNCFQNQETVSKIALDVQDILDVLDVPDVLDVQDVRDVSGNGFLFLKTVVKTRQWFSHFWKSEGVGGQSPKLGDCPPNWGTAPQILSSESIR